VFIHLAVQHPKPGQEPHLIESMRRFGRPAEHAQGMRLHAILKDEATAALVGITVWDSRDAWEAVTGDMRAAVKDDPFDEWWERPPEVFFLTEIDGPGETGTAT
jgi:heme-degrading monooxygenase HmoA